jgi:very-short-patch-repair endonuclease
MVLLGFGFNGESRDRVRRELSELQADGVIALGRDDKWRAVWRQTIAQPADAAGATHRKNFARAELLVASAASFRTSLASLETEDEPADDAGVSPDPRALLRYYRSALQSDPRGALTQTHERHGAMFQMLAGQGTLFPSEGETVVLRVRVDGLPNAFREALARLEGEENGVALGWPLAVGRQSGAPAIRPVGLLAATWARDGGAIDIRIEADDVVINPAWVRAFVPLSGWSRQALEELFRGPGGAGLTGAEFLSRLSEAAARAVKGSLRGNGFAATLDPHDEGIHDALAVFLPSGSSFTAGAVRDLDAIAAWPEERLSRTALAPLIGLTHKGAIAPRPAINTGPLNLEQIEAAARAMTATLSVVTGPPGTGKSQAIVAMAATALWDGQRVLVASKNHQALDAVEERLSGIAPDAPFLVRTLDPARDLDRGMSDVLDDLVNAPAGGAPGPDPRVAAELHRLAHVRAAALERIAERRAMHIALAEDIERLEARRLASVPERVESEMLPPSFWRRLLQRLGLARKPREMIDGDDPIATGALLRRIAVRRAHLSALGSDGDPVALTKEIEPLARNVVGGKIAAAATPSEDRRLALSNARDDLALHGQTAITREVADALLSHRPLWLASVLGTPKRVPLEDGLFDLVVFDEASQCDIASALPLLARARRAVIVGDDRQLAFIPQLGVAQDRNLMAAQRLPTRGMGRFAQSRKSLFDLALSTPGVPAVMLRDQYRSAADIVGYINRDFYGGRLRVAADQRSLRVPTKERPGLAWTDVAAVVDSTRRHNVNDAEIGAIVGHLEDLLIEQAYDGSVGIVTPFRPQALALAEAVAARLPAERCDAAELRIGTVDSFQGQERDLILFSPVVHARAAPSAVAFLQKDWRRLNVAISRARAVAHVFGDLTYARSGAIRRLQSLAARATEPRQPAAEGVFDSMWERRLYEAMRGRGLEAEPQYEIAGRRLDFALFLRDVKLDVEVDGRQWHQDADGNRKLDDYWRDHQLRSLGWRVRRFWVDDLHNDLEGCLDLIERDLA